MSGDDVKKKLSENGYKLVDIAAILGVIPQNLHSILKSDDVKTGVLEKIAFAINKDICFFFEPVGSNIYGNRSIVGGHGSTIKGNVNISLPERGYQKIIRSDGTETIVEVASSGHDVIPHDFAAEKESLLGKINDLERIIALQDRLLESK
jgi:hypothetical protein